jgi:hypothetical protein
MTKISKENRLLKEVRVLNKLAKIEALKGLVPEVTSSKKEAQ